MNTQKIIAGIIGVLAIAVFGLQTPKLVIPKIKTSPKLDGTLDDPAWKGAMKLTDFYIHRDKTGRQTKDTEVFIVRDDKFLYLAFICFNPHMRFLDQRAVRHDDPSVFKDDSVEIFITRKGMNRYYHYVLTYANVRNERRIVLGEGHDLGWSYPWFSATTQTEKGWTAEIAIPLSVLNDESLNDVTINFLRNKINVKLDFMGAKNGEAKEHSFWSPVKKNAHEPENFGKIEGLKNIQAPNAFLVDISKARMEEFNIGGGEFSFVVKTELTGRSPVSGEVRLEIVEQKENNETVISGKTLKLPSRCKISETLTVRMTDFSPKIMMIRLTDNVTGLKLDEKPLDFKGTLLKDAYPELSFYTKEKTFRIKTLLNLSAAALKDMTLELVDRNGRKVNGSDDLQSETILTANVDIMSIGKNKLSVILKNENGKVLGEKAITVIRLEPNKGSESKVDYFRRIVLMNGKPYFPYGIVLAGTAYSSVNDDVFKKTVRSFAGLGMNVVAYGYGAFTGKRDIDELAVMGKELAQIDINILFWGGLRPVAQASEKLKDLNEQKQCSRKFYEKKVAKNIINCVSVFKNAPNFLGWWGCDEPNLGNFKVNLYSQKLFWDTIKEIDPYHSMFGLFARNIPNTPDATKYYDILAYDVYTYPNWNGSYSEVCDSMAAYSACLERRASVEHHPIWMMPLPTGIPGGRSPRILTGQENLCQSYTAIIYGAKGLVFFNGKCVYGKDTWDSLGKLGRHIAKLSPALLNKPVRQNVCYESGDYNVARWQVPPVPFCFFRYPDGTLIALAVNGKNYPVDLTAKIDGLLSARRIFENEKVFKVDKERFSDYLESYATRAYFIKTRLSTSGIVSAKLSTKPHPDRANNISSNDSILTQARKKKNLIANPSLEMQKVPGIPDFFTPQRVLVFKDVGEQNSHWFLDKNNPKFGQVSLRMKGYSKGNSRFLAGAYGIFARPRNPEKPHVFSFYARSLEDNQKLWVGIPGKYSNVWQLTSKVFNISKEWKRYSMPAATMEILPISCHYALRPVGESTIWIDGIQLEEGTTPSEYSE